MNRREFLGTLGVVAALPILPALGARETYTWAVTCEDVARKVIRPMGGMGGDYVAFIHPGTWRSIVEYGARYRWEIAWRNYRVARRENVCGYLAPRQVLERFAPPSDALVAGEVGRFEGFHLRELGP